MRLFHFSDRADIGIFEPRPPTTHPTGEPLVYAIDEWHSALYLFPRDCPRISVWPIHTTTEEDVRAFRMETSGRMRLYIDRRHADGWENGEIFRYELDPRDPFEDLHDHGVWVSRKSVHWKARNRISPLPREAEREGVAVTIVDSLAKLGDSLLDPTRATFTTTLHVSMIRMSRLADWSGTCVIDDLWPRVGLSNRD